MSYFSDSYVLDPKSGVWSRQENDMAFDYSDGSATEEKIAEIIQNASDLSSSSDELTKAIVDWPTQAHFSRKRANLFRPIQDHLGGSILEIGSGCGAITRFLGECAEKVVAVEGSSRRASITASRCRDLSNVHVICDNIQTLDTNEKYDVVTLIGVLEYSRLFIEGTDPIQAMLNYCRNFLKPDGILLIAIENQLGLKYFSGAPEDHGSPPYHGIMDLYTHDSTVTFGRKELATKIEESGFTHTHFLYPMPDYKLPGIVLHNTAFDEPFDFLSMLCTSNDFRGHPGREFSEEAVWPILVRNGLAQDFMNSFLVIATNSSKSILNSEDRVHFYASERARPFQKVTHIKRDISGLIVKREKLNDEIVTSSGKYSQVIEDEPFYSGELYYSGLIRIVNRENWTVKDVAAWAKPWLDYLISKAIITDESHNSSNCFSDILLPSNFVDLTPFNTIILSDNSLHAFDLEYKKNEPVSFSFVAFRGLFISFSKIKTVASTNIDTHIISLVKKTLSLAGFSMSQKQIDNVLEEEIEFQRFISSGTSNDSSEKKNLVNDIYTRISIKRKKLPMRKRANKINLIGKIFHKLKYVFRSTIKTLFQIDRPT